MREHVRDGTEAIDGLRGIAILLVVFYHTWLFSWFTPELALFGHALPVDIFPRNGYLGVDLFFTISGFVLFYPEASRARAGDSAPRTTREYAFRRFIKIVPSYAIALVASFFFSIEYAPIGDLVRNLATHAFFVQNGFVDAFGTANSVFWSLAVEVQFYLVFPLVAIAFRRSPWLAWAALTVGAFAYRHAVAGCCIGLETVTRQMPAYLDLFASGMLAASLVVRIRATVRDVDRYAWAFTLAAVGCAYGAFALMASADTVQYVPLGPQRWDVANRTLVAFAGGGLALCSCLALRAYRAALANPILVFLSIVSYNVYLWHTLLMVWMWKHDVPRAATPNPHDDGAWKIAYIALGWSAVLLVSTAITYFVERPLLGLVKPQRFAFDWSRVVRAWAPGARSETRT